MRFLRFIFTKSFWIQVLIAAGVTLLLCLAYLFWLDWYTNHDQRIAVPDLKNKTLTQVDELLGDLDLRRKVIDSSSYNPSFAPRTVIEHTPPAGIDVKENRQIYIKLNASGYGMVTVPNVIFKTKRQAIPTLRTLGFEIGDITYKPNYAENTILEIKHKGSNVQPGDQLRKTSVLDLVIADGNRAEETTGEEEPGDTTTDGIGNTP
jgi:Uncharacterized protein conserved in bacteria